MFGLFKHARRPRRSAAPGLRSCSGQATTEYILTIGLIVIPIAAAYNRLAEVVKNFLGEVCKLLYGPGL